MPEAGVRWSEGWIGSQRPQARGRNLRLGVEAGGWRLNLEIQAAESKVGVLESKVRAGWLEGWIGSQRPQAMDAEVGGWGQETKAWMLEASHQCLWTKNHSG